MSVSQWRELVAAGVAPPPAIRGSRFTRWRIADVCDYISRACKAGRIDAQPLRPSERDA